MGQNLMTTRNARDPGTQNVVAARFTINATDPALTSGNKQVATVPAGAIIIGTDMVVAPAFAGGTPALSLGSNNPTTTNLGTFVVTAGLQQNVAPTGTLVGALAADTPIFAKGATGATSGQAIVIIKYALGETTTP